MHDSVSPKFPLPQPLKPLLKTALITAVVLVIAAPMLAVSVCRADDLSNATKLQKLIDTAYKSGQKKVTIPAGTYRLEGRPSWTLAYLNLNHMHDFEIDASGVNLIDTVPKTCVWRFDGCQHVTLRGVTVDHDPLPFSQGTIESIDDKGNSVKIRVASGYPANLDDPKAFPNTFQFNAFDRATRSWKRDASCDMGVASVKRLGPDEFRFQLGRAIPPQSTIRAGDPVAWRGYLIPDIGIVNCADMTLTGVTVRSGTGCCIYEVAGEGRNHYESCKVTRGPRPPNATEDPLFASNADAFDSTSMRHGPTLEKCLFEYMDDDGIDMASYYGWVVAAASKSLVVDFRYGQVFRPGDTVRFLDDRYTAAGTAKVKDVRLRADFRAAPAPPSDLSQFKNQAGAKYYELTFDTKVVAKAGWLLSNADAISDGYVVRDCVIRHNRARGMLIRASDGLIEGCTIEGTTSLGIALVPEIEYWDNADYARNITVRNNSINDVCVWPTNIGAAVTVDAVAHGSFVPLPGGHRNITIEDNTFQNNDGANLLISSAEDVNITGNHFVRADSHALPQPTAKNAIPRDVLTYFAECKNVKVTANVVSAPGPYLRHLVETSGKVQASGLPSGIHLQKPQDRN